MSVNPFFQQDIESKKRQALARVYALLLADQKEIEAQTADVREMAFIRDWLGLDNQEPPEVEDSQKPSKGSK